MSKITSAQTQKVPKVRQPPLQAYLWLPILVHLLNIPALYFISNTIITDGIAQVIARFPKNVYTRYLFARLPDFQETFALGN